MCWQKAVLSYECVWNIVSNGFVFFYSLFVHSRCCTMNSLAIVSRFYDKRSMNALFVYLSIESIVIYRLQWNGFVVMLCGRFFRAISINSGRFLTLKCMNFSFL